MRRALWLVVVALVALGPSPSRDDPRDGRTDGSRGPDRVARRHVLRVGVTTVGTLDPAQARSPEQLLVADQLFDSLTAFDPVTADPVPSLAARWEVTPDQREWTFVLRPGALFANGRPVTAADVKYSLERLARRGFGSPGAELLQGVAGYLDFRNGAPELAGVTVPGPDVVRITLGEPHAELVSALASPVLGVVPREAVEASPPAPAFADAPVGSGPFRLAGRRGTVLFLARSAEAADGVRAVEVAQYDTVGDAYRAFTRGELDWARVPPEEVAGAAGRYGEGAFRPYVAQTFYAFNLRNPKLADPRLREAMVRAIDRRAVVAAVYQGTVRLGDGIVAAGVPGHVPGACTRCGHDPDLARRLLAEAFPAGAAVPEIGLDYDIDPTQEAIARAIQASVAEVGITLTLRPREADAYDELLQSDEREVFRLGWVAAYPSPDAVLPPLFRSGSPNNLTGFASTAVDQLLEAARAEADRGRRTALYQEAERAILDQVPVIPIAEFQFHAVVSKRVRNLVMTSLGTFDASTVSLARRR